MKSKPDFDRMSVPELLQYAADKQAEAAKHLRRASWGFALAAVGLALQFWVMYLRHG